MKSASAPSDATDLKVAGFLRNLGVGRNEIMRLTGLTKHKVDKSSRDAHCLWKNIDAELYGTSCTMEY